MAGGAATTIAMNSTVRKPNNRGFESLESRFTTVPVTGPCAVVACPVPLPTSVAPPAAVLEDGPADGLPPGLAAADPAATALPSTTTQLSGVPTFWQGLGCGAFASTTSWPFFSVGLSQLLDRLGSGIAPGILLACSRP